jgi:MFS family permease
MTAPGARQPMPAAVRRLLGCHALASVGMSLPWPLLLVLVWTTTGEDPHGDLLLGLTAAARMLPYVALSWATGPLADRFRRDRLLRVTLAARAVLLVAVAVAVGQGWLLAAVLAATAAVAAGTPAYPALTAAMPTAAGPAGRRATNLLVTVEVGSFVVGPALGGLLLVGPPRWVLPWVGVLLTALAGALVVGVALPRPARHGVRAAGADGPAPAAGRLAALRASPAATRAVGVVALLNGVVAVLVVALLPVAGRLWHGGGSGYGPATGLLGLGALGAPLLWRLGSTASGRARWGLLLMAGALSALPLTRSVGAAALPLLVAGAACVHVEGAATEAIQAGVPDRVRAGVLGLTDSVMVGAGLLGSLVAPWLCSVLGPIEVLLALAGASLATVAVLGVRPTRATVAAPAHLSSRGSVAG